MKRLFFFCLLFTALVLGGNHLSAQNDPHHWALEDFHFDYEVTQVLVHNGKDADSAVLHSFYRKNGVYAAARISGKMNKKEDFLVIANQDGIFFIFDDHKKTITIVNSKKILSDLASITKWIKMDSLIANFKKKSDGKQIQSVKTGNTKQVGSYTAEEYMVSDSSHKVSVWCAKVDFPTPSDYILGSSFGNMIRMMSSQQASGHPLMQALLQPKTLITEIDHGGSHNGNRTEMYTRSIAQVATTIPIAGYQVNDYSDMTFMEILQAEMKKRDK